MNAILECTGLSMGYEGKPVFSDLSMRLPYGAFLSIIGENGSGKSTFAKGLLGLLSPLEGKLILSEDVRGKIGYLPQQSMDRRNFPASVREIVLSGIIHKNKLFHTKADKLKADEVMELLDILEISYCAYQNLSVGQQQRVLLARALCAASVLLLLDEPASSLDPEAAESLYELIASLNRDKSMTIIMVSHDIDASLRLSSHILHMGDGNFFGTSKEYIHTIDCDFEERRKLV